ncbi:MAG TPA: TraR/DksA C4-type zinc finger protein [Anaeromyxobacteraceae bacterium]
MDATSAEAARLLGSRRRALEAAEAAHRAFAPAELTEIDAALGRIADGTYGACEVCGGAIGRDRLRALPEIRRCVGCSSERPSWPAEG